MRMEPMHALALVGYVFECDGSQVQQHSTIQTYSDTPHIPTTLLPYPSETTETIDEDSFTHWHIIPTQIPKHGAIHCRLPYRQTTRLKVHRHRRHSLY